MHMPKGLNLLKRSVSFEKAVLSFFPFINCLLA